MSKSHSQTEGPDGTWDYRDTSKPDCALFYHLKTLFCLFIVSCLYLSTACQHRHSGLEMPSDQIPSDLGRGLRPIDSLQAVLLWLVNPKSYQAETLRFHYLYKFIVELGRKKPDTLPSLALVAELSLIHI